MQAKFIEKVQKRENLNLLIGDGIRPDGSFSKYTIVTADDCHDILVTIPMQTGPRKSPDSIHGALDSDLLEIVKHRIDAFQGGDFACDENEKVLEAVNTALYWLNKRVEDRIARDVLGENKK